MALTPETNKLPTRDRILSVCVRLFLEKGYAKTTVADIVHGADCSNSSFQHFFRAKDGVLTELARFLFQNQSAMPRQSGSALPKQTVYAVEIAAQLAIAELSDNLRELYLEAYAHQEALSFIQQAMGQELFRVFGEYQPTLTETDFQVVALGVSGILRGYMTRPCDETLPLEKKLRYFLTAVLRSLKVPEEEVQKTVDFVLLLDIHSIAQSTMENIFKALSLRYDFSLSGLLPEA